MRRDRSAATTRLPRYRAAVTVACIMAATATIASLPSTANAGVPTRHNLLLPWKSPLGSFGKLYGKTTTTTTTTKRTTTAVRTTTPAAAARPGPMDARPLKQQQQPIQTKPAAAPARNPSAAYVPPAAKQTANTAVPYSTTSTPRLELETTTHDRAIITAPLKRCPEGQRVGPDRNCMPNYTDPEDEAD